MRLFLKFFVGLIVLVFVALAMQTDETYTPSIAALGPNETLVMKYSDCHSGCIKGTVSFKKSMAMMGSHRLNLTSTEVRDLDNHFLLADNLDDTYFCSARVMIGFKKKRSLRLPVKRKPRLYPCVFLEMDARVTPAALIYHFNVSPNETPDWKLRPKEQILTVED